MRGDHAESRALAWDIIKMFIGIAMTTMYVVAFGFMCIVIAFIVFVAANGGLR